MLEQTRRLVSAGFGEIVITGVDIASYDGGTDGRKARLPDLVSGMLAVENPHGFRHRVRLSSIEPMLMDRPFLEELATRGGNRLCRHFHLPLQSGSSRVLENMGRGYDLDFVVSLVESIRALFPGVAIGADIMAGYPGETEQDFEATLQMLRLLQPAYLHVFPFSPRPGTRAATMRRIRPEIVAGRSARVRSLGLELRKRFRESQLGTVCSVVVEGRAYGDESGWPVGMTDNYIPVMVQKPCSEGEFLDIELTPANVCWALR